MKAEKRLSVTPRLKLPTHTLFLELFVLSRLNKSLKVAVALLQAAVEAAAVLWFNLHPLVLYQQALLDLLAFER